jgi:glycosyltransferase involved in cell wall biosynthesis
MKPTSDIWVIIPAYNEAQVIDQVLADLSHFAFKVIVVDDGSSDLTADRAADYPVTILRHATNLGQGAALQTGISYAVRSQEAAYIVTFDADGQHHASDIQALVDVCRQGNYDVVLGSRFINGGQVENMPLVKTLVLKLAVLFSRRITGLNLTDTHNGLRVLSNKAAARIQITQNGMAHASEILSQIAEHHLSYVEMPVTITYTDYSRHKGQSIFNGINILWDMLMGKMK